MIKRILIMLAIFVVLFAFSFGLHNFLLETPLRFSIANVYLFHAITAVLVYIGIELMSEHLPNQAGYAYLMLMCFKIGFFVLLFQGSVFSIDKLTQPERIALVVPLFIFLIAEAIGVAKLLNSK